jgi:hypothetical protein
VQLIYVHYCHLCLCLRWYSSCTHHQCLSVNRYHATLYTSSYMCLHVHTAKQWMYVQTSQLLLSASTIILCTSMCSLHTDCHYSPTFNSSSSTQVLMLLNYHTAACAAYADTSPSLQHQCAACATSTASMQHSVVVMTAPLILCKSNHSAIAEV